MLSRKLKITTMVALGLILSFGVFTNNLVVFAKDTSKGIQDVMVERIPNNNKGTRFDTAAAISRKGWPNGSSTAILVTGYDYPDALSATPLAKKYNAPILLTNVDKIPEVTLNELRSLKVKKIILVGGQGVISSNVEDQLKEEFRKVERIDGKDRFETSINVAKKIGSDKGIVVTYGFNYVDALSVAPIAASEGMPIILTPTNEIKDSVDRFLQDQFVPKSYIIGGVGAINNETMNKFDNPTRIGGQDRFETNVNILKTFEKNINYDKVYVATAMDYPDALAGSSLASLTESPLILTRSNSVENVTLNFAKRKMSKEIYGLGGSAVVNDKVLQTLRESMKPGILATVENKTINVKLNSDVNLPDVVEGTLQDGRKKDIKVKWDENYIDTSEVGTKTYEGIAGGKLVTLTVNISNGIIEPKDIYVEITKGDKYTLPKFISVSMADGSIKDVNVKWNGTIDINKPGTQEITGVLEEENIKVKLILKVRDQFKVIDIK